MAHSTSVNGTICMLQKLRPKDSPTDLLFVGTDRFQYFTALWDPKTSRLRVIQEIGDVGEKHMRDSQSQDRCLVDPSGRFMGMHLYEGVLHVMRLLPRGSKTLLLELMDQVRLSELFIKASTFLYTETGHPKIAFLYQTRSDTTESKLVMYRFTEDDRNATSSRFDRNRDREYHRDIGDGNALLIPVRKVEEEVKRHNFRNPDASRVQLGGLLIVGETRILYIDEVTKGEVEANLTEASIFVAWAEYDPAHYFLADDYGVMHVLYIHTDGAALVTTMEVQKIGITSRASCLEYLGDDLLFVGSHYGDSQLYRVELGSTTEPYLQPLQKLHNIAPILDFTVMDMGSRDGDSQLGNEYSSGQARLVTGSGVHQDGSLRSVRSGVGLEDVGILGELEHTRGIFPLRSSPSAGKTDVLAVSSLTETRVFKFAPDGEIEEVSSFIGMTLDSHTLLVTNLNEGYILQVTPLKATLVDVSDGVVVTSWSPPEGMLITNASANHHYLLLSVDGTHLVSFDLIYGMTEVRQLHLGEADQVACIHVAPGLDNIGVVGFWGAGSVAIIDLTTLQPIRGAPLRKTDDGASIPRDIALVRVLPSADHTLFVAMEDGNVITFSVSPDYVMSGRNSVLLGTRQARLHLIPKTGDMYSIFATSEHPSLIYGSEGRIIYSAVTAEEAEYVCPFDTEAFPDSIVVASESEIKLSQIDSERRTHVRPLPMKKMVRRIAYSAKEKVFGLGCIKRDLVDGEEIVQSSFELVDEVVFEKLGKPFLLETVQYLELVECVIRAELPGAYGSPVERFLVGTSFSPNPDMGMESQSRGRILILGVDSKRNPYLVMSHQLKGGCRCLAVMPGSIIVAGLTKTVVVSQYTELSTTSGQMKRLASYRPSTYPVDLAIDGNMIGVADLMKSMTLVEFIPGDAAENQSPKLVECARHFQSGWATAICHVEDNSWLEADAEGNLLVLRRNTEGVTADDRRRLEVTSEINLGEQVNRIRKINVETSPNATIIPRAFLGTVR